MRAHNFEDLTGQTFGRLIVLRYLGNRVHDLPNGGAKQHSVWLCRCRCGREWPVDVGRVKDGPSCGCFSSRTMIGWRSTTHGLAETREYRRWCHMKGRCCNPTDSQYAGYGGRGITVCQQWIDSFERFLDDMGPCPPKWTLERKDVNGGYNPANCIWAPMKDQQNNRRNNHVLYFDGITLTVQQWAEKLKMPASAILARIRLKKPLEECLYPYNLRTGRPYTSTTSPRNLIEFSGKSMTIAEWGREVGIGATTIRERLHRGWTVEETLTKFPKVCVQI
jgi:hypothetical protein